MDFWTCVDECLDQYKRFGVAHVVAILAGDGGEMVSIRETSLTSTDQVLVRVGAGYEAVTSTPVPTP